ncbi:hypothetical protein ACFLS1_11530, partial [Verrucomicrobiota bacterium]
FATKRFRVVGSLNMGLCRGGSILLGASAACGQWNYPLLIAFLCVSSYTASVSFIAARETERNKLCVSRWMPFSALLICFTVLFCEKASFVSGGAAAAVLVLTCVWAVKLKSSPDVAVVKSGVTVYLRGLLLIQTVFCGLMPGAGTWAAIILLLLIPISTLLEKKFYAT